MTDLKPGKGAASSDPPTATPADGAGGGVADGAVPGLGTAPHAAAPAHTSSPLTRVLGWIMLPAFVSWVLYSLVWSPADAEMEDAVRLFYIHVPVVIFLSLACILATVASAMWLRRRSSGWDALAFASAELAAVLGALTLVTGAIWGRPTWGTYWSWDPRLTTSALLFVLTLGYLAVRRLSPDGGATGSVPAAVVGLLLLPNVIVVRYSVDWWDSLHQSATVNTLDPEIEGDMFVAWGFGMLTAGLVFAWLLIHRFRVAYLEQQVQNVELEAAVAARRAEASGGVPAETGVPALGRRRYLEGERWWERWRKPSVLLMYIPVGVLLAQLGVVVWVTSDDMVDKGYVAAGWLVTLIGVATYAVFTLRQGRRLSVEVPPEARRWS